MSLWTCRTCGGLYAFGTYTCPKCGAVLDFAVIHSSQDYRPPSMGRADEMSLEAVGPERGRFGHFALSDRAALFLNDMAYAVMLLAIVAGCFGYKWTAVGLGCLGLAAYVRLMFAAHKKLFPERPEDAHG